MTRWWPVLLALTGACVTDLPPGDEVLGTFHMHAAPLTMRCTLSDVVPAEFDFDATVSREMSSGAAFVTLKGYSRSASFDGQTVRSQVAARRVFTDCGACDTELVEELQLVVFSLSQSQASASVCPDDGLAPAPDVDAGITLPGQTDQGYDAVQMCGRLIDRVRVATPPVDGGTCPAECGNAAPSPSVEWSEPDPANLSRACAVTYRLSGVRR